MYPAPVGRAVRSHPDKTERGINGMELKIRNGDYVADGRGGAERLSGSAELIQRVLYRLTARREGFPFLPELGSTLYRLGTAAPKQRSSAAEQAVRQALQEEPDVEVTAVTLAEVGKGLYTLRVYLSYQGQDLEVALTIQ